MMAGSTVENLSNPEMSDGDWAPTNLRKNLCILSHNEIDLAKMLIKEKQGHLFEHWPEPGIDDAAKHGFFNQVTLLNNSYPGGLLSYIRNARSLLADSKAGKNPYDGFIPSVPSGEVLSFGDENFMMLEEVGVKEACRAAFVPVAGGLGERLGYNGIKLALPSESTSGTLFLQHYIESILALQDASCKLVEGSCQRQIPLVIMTSDDTHSRTLKLLESNAYFGMSSSQVILLKQEKVACLADNDASLALDPNDKYKIQEWKLSTAATLSHLCRGHQQSNRSFRCSPAAASRRDSVFSGRSRWTRTVCSFIHNLRLLCLCIIIQSKLEAWADMLQL